MAGSPRAVVVRTNAGSTYTHGVLPPDRRPATGSRGQPRARRARCAPACEIAELLALAGEGPEKMTTTHSTRRFRVLTLLLSALLAVGTLVPAAGMVAGPSALA